MRAAFLDTVSRHRLLIAVVLAFSAGVGVQDSLDRETDDLVHHVAHSLLLPILGLNLLFAVLAAIAVRKGRLAHRDQLLLRQAIEVVPCQFAVYDRRGELVAYNASYRALHARAFATLVPPITFEKVMRVAVQQTHKPEDVEAEVARRIAAQQQSDGKPFERLYPNGRWMHVVRRRLPGGETAGFALDITDVKAAQQQIDFLARHDPLTGLANRGTFIAALDAAVQAGRACTLLLIDLDHFKQVNDRHGHSAGDALLREAARRMRDALRPQDLIARLGGDEFAVLVHGVGAEQAAPLAARLHAALSQPVPHGDALLILGASIGLAAAPEHAADPEALQRAADLALYAAKAAGRGCLMPFSAQLARREMRGSWLRAALAETLETGAGLSLAWQVQVDARDRSVVGAEALLRWHCAALDEQVSPIETLEAACEAGLSARLDAMVLDHTLAQAAAWRGRAGLPQLIAVNATSASLRDQGFPAAVAVALARHDVPASMLEIEIPESLGSRDLDAITPVLQGLAELGVRIALDDFGAGHSGLAHALKLPISRLKLDRSVVAGLPQAAKSRAMLRAITALARSLEIEVLAEGVETEAQAFALRREGVTAMQGYLFGRPVPADRLAPPLRLVRAG